MKKVLVSLLVLLSLTGLLFANGTTESGSSTSSGKQIVLRYAENQPQDYPTTRAAYDFAKMVEEKTNGRIKVEVYYGAQLGDEKAVMEQMQFGAIDMARVSLSPLAEFNKVLDVLQLPYLYRDTDHMWKVLDGEIGDEFLASMESANLVGLSWYDAGARHFYNSVRPITKLSDMKGLKIRVQESELMMNMVSALGAVPTPMAYGEVYSALQTGVIDGAENNWPSYESTSHYEVAPYLVLDGHTRVPEMQIISKITWDKLSAEDQAIIKECAVESAKLERQYWAEEEKTAEQTVREGGVTVTELEEGELEKFQAAVAPLYEKYDQDMIARIQSTN